MSTPTTTPSAATADSAATVLIIDDSPENRYVVRRALTRAGMEVIEAGTGAEGSQLAHSEPEPDLIVLDVNLPDINGFDLCRRFKSDPHTAHVPVVHLSQSAVDSGSRVRGLEGGADAYLTDPIHASVLVATVRALLRMRRAEDLLRQQAEDAARMSDLNSDLNSARTEAEAVASLVEATTTTPWPVHRISLFPARPWFGPPRTVYPDDLGRVADEPLPVSPSTLSRSLDAILAEPHRYPHRLLYDDTGPRHWALVPLVAYGDELGSMLYEFADGVRYPRSRHLRLATAAERCAQTMERARLFERQRGIALELQSSLLPATLPSLPGLEVAAEYRAGAEQMMVGGDFYDVFPGARGWTAIIGDVCGRGAAAAARTSLARHTAREAARHDSDPVSVLSALERAMAADRRESLDLISAIALSLCVCEDTAQVAFAVAGHPLPILVRADGGVEEVGRPGPILGISAADFPREELRLEPGDSLFLYTDGVTESRRNGAMLGEQRLMNLLSTMVRAGASIQELACDPITVAASYNERHDDDMATLVIRAAPHLTDHRCGGPHDPRP
ncbi:MAG TPA: fused response regulator/phosphatase [Solirubrobacteraceae bacterium]|nr:fused response regulator/phosphatase [Solirubrobacteraceae bacterium]